MSTERRRIGDRRDGKLVRDVDGMHLITPMLYPNRCDNEAFISERIDLTETNKYIAKLNEGDPKFKYTLFHIIVASILKALMLRPKLNRFIQNKNTYQRNKFSASFVVRKHFDDKSEEGLAIVYAEKDSNLQSLHEDLYKMIYRERSSEDAANSTNNAMDILTKVPRWFVKFFVWLMRVFDRFGIVPHSLIDSDPYYASVILTNLGSIKLKSGYHHLTNWGTTSVFVIVGEIKNRLFTNADGTEEMRPSVDLGFTIDERLADGYYYSKSIKLFKYIVEHPECLERPFGEEIDLGEIRK